MKQVWRIFVFLFLLLAVSLFSNLTGLTIFPENLDLDRIYFSSETPADLTQDYSAQISVVYDLEGKSYSLLNVNDSLIGWYRGEDNLEDSSGYGNTLSAPNGISYSSGVFGRAFKFDGESSYLNLSSGIFDDLDEFTVSLWVRRESDYPSMSTHYILNKGAYNQINSTTWVLSYEGNGTLFRSAVGQDILSKQIDAFPLDEWTQVVMTYDRRSVLTTYLNGDYLSKIHVDSSSEGNFFEIILGARYSKLSQELFEGSMDEIMIFDEVLSGEEVVQLYNNSLGQINRKYEGGLGSISFQGLAVNESGHVFSGERRTFTLMNSLAPPQIKLYLPANESYTIDNSVSFLWEVESKSNSPSFLCDMILDGSKVFHGEVLAGSEGKVLLEGLSEGLHFWSVSCEDDFGNFQKTDENVFTIDSNPLLEIFSPKTTSWQKDSFPFFNISSNPSQEGYAFLDWNESLVLWLRGEKGLVDESSHLHEIFNEGGVSVTPEGMFGKGIMFDGENYLVVDNSGGDFDFDFEKDFSWSFWFLSLDGSDNYFIESGWRGKPRMKGYGNNLQIYFESPFNFEGLDASTSVTDEIGNWHHCVGVWDAGNDNLSIYVDGALRNSVIATEISQDYVNYQDLFLGRGLVGSMDEIMIFNRVLRSGEVSSLYNSIEDSLSQSFSSVEGQQINYGIYSVDENGRDESYSSYITVEIVNSPPKVVLESPAFFERQDRGTIQFECFANDTNGDTSIESISLFSNESGSFLEVDSQSFSSEEVGAKFVRSIDLEKSILWNCYSCDNNGNCAFADENRTLIVGPNNFYVSSEGDDSGQGTLEDPFRTIQRCAETLIAGDTCYIREGIYRESVVPTHSGVEGAEITFRNYPGEEVTISGSEVLDSWSLYGGDIYKTSDMYWSLGDGQNQIFNGDQMMVEARWPNLYSLDIMRPNLSSYGKGTKTFGYRSGSASIADPSQDFPEGELEGSRIVTTYPPRYSTFSGVVTSSMPGKLNVTLDVPIYANHPIDDSNLGEYYLYGNYNLLDAEGEWWYDEASRELFIIAIGGGVPEGITAKKRDLAFDLSNRSYIRLLGLNIESSTIITDSLSNNLVLDSLSVRYPDHYSRMIGAERGRYGCGTSGIILDGWNNVFKNGIVGFTPGSGISLRGRGHSILNSTIFNVDYMGTITGGISTGIEGLPEFITRDMTVIGNNISYSGRDIVRHDYSENFRLIGNELFDASVGFLTRDLGVVNSVSTNHRGSEIAYNQIHDEGYSFTGIYFDSTYANNISIHHNLIYGVRWGILGFKDNMKIYHNTIDITGVPKGNNNAGFYGTFQHSNFEGTEIKNNLILGYPEDSIDAYDDSYDGDLSLGELRAFYPGEVLHKMGGNVFTATPENYFVDSGNHDYRLVSGTDNGETIQWFNCPFSSEEESFQEGCVNWFGVAPDAGAYEYPENSWSVSSFQEDFNSEVNFNPQDTEATGSINVVMGDGDHFLELGENLAMSTISDESLYEIWFIGCDSGSPYVVGKGNNQGDLLGVSNGKISGVYFSSLEDDLLAGGDGRPDEVYIILDGEGNGAGYFDNGLGKWVLGSDDILYSTNDVLFGGIRGDISMLPSWNEGAEVLYLPWMAISPTNLQGDCNGDGSVGLDDFIILKQNFGSKEASFSEGDFNGDGSVNLADFIILKQNFGSKEGPCVGSTESLKGVTPPREDFPIIDIITS